MLIGAQHYEGEILRFTIGFDLESRTFDDCRGVPFDSGAVYLFMSEQTPGPALLEGSGAHLLARVPRPGDAYRLYSAPSAEVSISDVSGRPEYQSQQCQERRAADATLPPATGP